MQENAEIALITLSGTLSAAAITSIIQFYILKTTIRAENEKIIRSAEIEIKSNRAKKKTDKLLDLISELLAIADPLINEKLDYKNIIRIVHRSQLLLDIKQENDQALNGALNQLALAIKDSVGLATNDANVDRKILNAHGKVLDAAKKLII